MLLEFYVEINVVARSIKTSLTFKGIFCGLLLKRVSHEIVGVFFVMIISPVSRIF